MQRLFVFLYIELTNVRVSNEMSRRLDIRSTLKSKADYSWIFWIVVGGFLASSWAGSKPDQWTDKLWYTVRYGAPPKTPARGCAPESRLQAFRPQQGQYAMELEVPQHLEKVKPKDLHLAVRVEIQGESHKLIANY
jgi:hypothetical protein